MFCRHSKNRLDRRGAMLPTVAVVMIILIIGAVFTVDIAHMHMVRAELRTTATDAAARAGAETLARTQDRDQAITAAINIASQNNVSGEGLVLARSDIEVGGVREGTDGKFEFVPDLQPFSTIRITGKRTEGSAGGPVNLFFAPLLGQSSFQPVQSATATSSVRDIALVLDVSGSMQTNDAGGGQTRNQALIAAVNVFIDEIEESSPNSAISVTTYSNTASRELPLTDNLASVRAAINNLGARGATNIFQGLRFGSDSLEQDSNRRPFADRTIIVMTDGNFNVGGNPLPSADVAVGRGHTIHTVTFSRGANQSIMRQVAERGDGIHLHADDAGDLTEAFREIARTLSVLLVE